MKRVLVILGLFAVGGCEVLGVQGVSVMATKKTLVDHAVSWGSGKNCSAIRKDRGLSYCVEDEKTTDMKVYCYPTLGEITCYEQPVFEDRQQRVRQGGEIPK